MTPEVKARETIGLGDRYLEKNLEDAFLQHIASLLKPPKSSRN